MMVAAWPDEDTIGETTPGGSPLWQLRKRRVHRVPKTRSERALSPDKAETVDASPRWRLRRNLRPIDEQYSKPQENTVAQPIDEQFSKPQESIVALQNAKVEVESSDSCRQAEGSGMGHSEDDLHDGSENSSRKDQIHLREFLLLQGFASVNAPRYKIACRGIKKTYPLHAAAKGADEKMLRILLDAKADASQKDSSKRTALDVARQYNYKGSHQKNLALLALRKAWTKSDQDDWF
jgi:hypothetical protein